MYLTVTIPNNKTRQHEKNTGAVIIITKFYTVSHIHAFVKMYGYIIYKMVI